MVVVGVVAVSYERGTPAPQNTALLEDHARCKNVLHIIRGRAVEFARVEHLARHVGAPYHLLVEFKPRRNELGFRA